MVEKNNAWGITVVIALAEFYVSISANPGGTANQAATKVEIGHFRSLQTSDIF